jgi:hypothetical protein
MKKKRVEMPGLVFKIEGSIKEFNRVDDAFKAIKAQTVKLLTDWTISLNVEYVEKSGTGEVP